MRRGAIFDMDGTLFDTEIYYRRAWFEAAPEFGEEPNVKFTEAVSGTSSGEEFIRVIKSFYPDVDAAAYLARVLQLVHDWSEEKLVVMEGVEEILKFFQAAGVKCAVASSSPTELIERNLRRTNLRGYFDAIVGGDQVSNGKPAPDIFLLAAKKINIAPSDCYVFEDSRNGILAAQAAGCTPILIVDQYKPEDHIKKICAGVYDNFTQAVAALQVRVAIIMGSDSDWSVMKKAVDTLKSFGVEVEVTVASAHRTPQKVHDFVKNSSAQVFIAAAGMAAHLAGVVASLTTKPVLGVPISSEPFKGLDSLLSTVQMPGGIPVATMAVNGAKNAALFATEILALKDEDLAEKLISYREQMAAEIELKDKTLQQRFKED